MSFPLPPRVGDEISVTGKWHRVVAVRRAADCVRSMRPDAVEEFAVRWRSRLGGGWAGIYWEADTVSGTEHATFDVLRVEATKRHHRVA